MVKLAKPDVWRDSKGVMDVMMETEKVHKIKDHLHKRGIKAAVMVEDVQKLVWRIFIH